MARRLGLRPLGPLKATLLLLACLCAWLSGFLVARLIPEAPLASAVHSILSLGQRPLLKAPAPRRQSCGLQSLCPPGTFSFHLRSGGRGGPASICFQDKLLLGEQPRQARQGLSVAVIHPLTGKVLETRLFDEEGSQSQGAVADFLRSVPHQALLLMATHSDGCRLEDDAQSAIEGLGSTEIRQVWPGTNWVFAAGKGFQLPAGVQREKVSKSRHPTESSPGQPSEVQIQGCVPREPG